MSSKPANAQARTLLVHAMCDLVLPLIQTVGNQGRNTSDVMAHLENKVEEVASALQMFIADMISSSQVDTSKDIGIEVKFADVKSHVDIEDGKARIDGALIQHHLYNVSSPLCGDSDIGRKQEDNTLLVALNEHLVNLRRDIQSRDIPTRLLCYESHSSKPKISFLGKGDIYPYLSRKLEADFRNSRNPNRQDSLWGDNWIRQHAGYAILSHRWTQEPGELTYGDWQKGSLDTGNPKCEKLVNFCKAAWENHGLSLGWIDTVCINKESSAELDESIRSMYVWYANSDVCITYLAETESLVNMHKDPWFRRGWTFQELVAPDCIKFYNKDWHKLGTNLHLDADTENRTAEFPDFREAEDLSWTLTQLAKEFATEHRMTIFRSDKEDPEIQKVIQRATTITPDELRNIRRTSISRRMQIAAKREVTRKEDIAYSLLGIFDVSISTAYGEGPERAFYRLVKEIFNSTKDVSDIFNWGKHDFYSFKNPWIPITTLFPSKPSDYESRSSQPHRWNPIEPLTLTHMGLRTPILLMPALAVAWNIEPIDLYAIGDYSAAVTFPGLIKMDTRRPWDGHPPTMKIDNIDTYYVLVKKVLHRGLKEVTFGTLNVERHGTHSLRIPKTCFAVLLNQDSDGVEMYTKIHTNQPIVFDLERRENDDSMDYYEIDEDEVEKHGMKLVTLYL